MGQGHAAPERAEAGIEIGIFWLVRRSAILRMSHFAGTQATCGCPPRWSGADDLVIGRVVEEVADQFGDPLVLIGHVGVGPHDDLAADLLGADPAGRADPPLRRNGMSRCWDSRAGPRRTSGCCRWRASSMQSNS